MTTPSK